MKKLVLINLVIMAIVISLICGCSRRSNDDALTQEINGGETISNTIDEEYLEFFNSVERAEDRLYGVGSAKQSTLSFSFSTAETRATADLARAYTSMVSVNEDSARITSNVNIKGRTLEKRRILDDGTVWVVVSARKDDIEIED